MKMASYIAKRLLLLIPVLIGVSILVFSLTRIAGDPAAAYATEKSTEADLQLITEKFHLDEPIINQYWYWLDGVIQGDWGYSKSAHCSVTEAIADFFPATFELALVSMLIAVVVGIWLGTISAVRRDTPLDHGTRILALSGVSLPIFWLALILQLVFYFNLGWMPLESQYSNDYIISGVPHITGFLLVDSLAIGDLTLFKDVLWHMILPAITLSFSTIAIITRIMRSSMLEVLNQDYVKTARAKGLSESVVIKKHARRNALIPTTTVVGLSFGGLLGGAVLTESIFSWPGLGRWSSQAILSNDWASILGFVLLTSVIYVFVNLIVDLLYAYLDPRVKLE